MKNTLAAAFLLLVLTIPVVAHHSFSAEYDGSKPITIKGTLKEVDWRNPHIYYMIESEETGTKPGVFTKPWVVRGGFALRPNERIREYECIEHNQEVAKFQKLLEKPELYSQPASQPQRGLQP